MTTKSHWMDRGVICVLGLMIVVDGALFLYVKRATYYTAQDPVLLYRFAGKHGPVPPPDGFTSKGVKVGIETGKPSGWAVRYAAQGCEYCRQDEALWGHMSANLKQWGYQIVVVVPDAKNEYPNDTQTPKGASQVSFVNMAWIKQFRLSRTPTLMIFDPNQGLIWSHQGTLAQGDPAAAVDAIKFWQKKSK